MNFDRKSPVDWVCGGLIIGLLLLLLVGCAPQSEKAAVVAKYPIGTVVSFVSAPDKIIGHVTGYDSTADEWRVYVRMISTGENEVCMPEELVIKSKAERER